MQTRRDNVGGEWHAGRLEGLISKQASAGLQRVDATGNLDDGGMEGGGRCERHAKGEGRKTGRHQSRKDFEKEYNHNAEMKFAGMLCQNEERKRWCSRAAIMWVGSGTLGGWRVRTASRRR